VELFTTPRAGGETRPTQVGPAIQSSMHDERALPRRRGRTAARIRSLRTRLWDARQLAETVTRQLQEAMAARSEESDQLREAIDQMQEAVTRARQQAASSEEQTVQALAQRDALQTELTLSVDRGTDFSRSWMGTWAASGSFRNPSMSPNRLCGGRPSR